MYVLRDYQKQASVAAVNYLRRLDRRNGIIVLPTGAGKSLVIADIVARLGEPVLIFQPSKEILEQNFSKLCSYGILDAGIYSASVRRKNISRITFATIGTVNNALDYFRRFRYAVIDECHLVNAEEGMYKNLIETLRLKVIGLTATPYRLYSSKDDGSMLRFITRTYPRIFSDVIYYVQVGELQDRGYLADMNYYQLNVVNCNMIKANTKGSDFDDESLKRYYKQIKYNDTLENIVRRLLVAGRQSVLVFTKFIEEAEYVVKQIGSDAAVVSSRMSKRERERILRDFKEKRIKVVANVGVLTTGFDFPELATVVLARPTMSLALYYQMCGRAIRPFGKKVSWIVDLCGNYKRFGRIDQLVLRQPEPGKWAVFSGGRQLTNVYFQK